MRLTWKRIAALLLGVVLCALLGPAVLAADEEEPAALEFAVSDWDGPSNDEMFTAYIQGLFYGTPRLRSPGSLAQTLGEVNYAIEQRLKAQIEAVAAGDRTSTEFVVDVSDLDMTQFDLTKVYGALLVDCTSSLYWHDIRLAVSASSNSPQELVFRFPVAMDYRVSQYEVDSTQIDRAKNAKTNADAILSEYASASDVDKLRGYMYEICKLNVYNDYAAAHGGTEYADLGIDPWQLVYVFDGDTDTNVVCEGYSKAFEYLCDNTDFNSSLIRCYCVSGYVYNTPTMGHMWNVIRMDDGDNYVIDVTWSEPDNDYAGNPTVSDYAMFLSYLVSGNIHDAYVLSGVSGNRNYFLGNTSSGKNMLDIYTEAELAISDHAYAGPHTHTAGEAVTENIVDPTCTQPGSYDEVICCSVCGHEMSRTKKTVAPLGHTAGEAAAENAVDPTCTEAGHHDEVVRCTVCQAELSRTPVTDAPALGHQLALEGWSWTGYMHAEATFICQRGCGHTETVAASMESTRIAEPSCIAEGSVEHRATVVLGEQTFSDVVTETLGMLPHTPGDPVTEITAPTCTEPGHSDEVVRCTVCGYEISRETTPGEGALGHSYRLEGWNWTGYTYAEAVFVCERDESHRETVPASIESECTAQPTLTQEGTVLHTATAVFNGTPYTNTATETLPCLAPPVITGGPEDVTATEGEEVTFTVTATGTGLSYQWYAMPPDADGWATMTGETGETLTVTAKMSLSGILYYCRVSNADGSADSPAAKLTVTEAPAPTDPPQSPTPTPAPATPTPTPAVAAPKITGQPADAKAVAGKTVTFTVTASGTGLKYQWYVQTSGSSSWAPVGGDSARLTVTAAAALDGARYRCVVTGEGGKTATSNEVTLTVVTVPKITAQPKKASVKAGKKVTFKVKASGYDLTYQWYYQKPGAKKWVKIKNAVKPSYSFKAGRSKNGYKYRCYVTNPAGTVKSKTAKLTVK